MEGYKMVFQTQNTNIQQQTQQEPATIEMEATFLYITPTINKTNGAPKEGTDKNGKPYKCWDVIFNKNGSQQNKVFEVFNDLNKTSLRLNQLVQGQLYKLVYEQGIIRIKKNKLFYVGAPETKSQGQQPIYTPAPNSNSFKPQTTQAPIHPQQQQIMRQNVPQNTFNNTPEEQVYIDLQGQNYQGYQAPLVKSIPNTLIPLKVTQDEFLVWNNPSEPFSTLKEWLSIASKSQCINSI
jgi:hypothetical protein